MKYECTCTYIKLLIGLLIKLFIKFLIKNKTAHRLTLTFFKKNFIRTITLRTADDSTLHYQYYLIN